MRIHLLLLLLSSIMIYGCLEQADEFSMAPSKSGDSVIIAPPFVGEAPCTRENPCVTVHTVVFDTVGKCPDDLMLGSQDIVKFVNRTEGVVRITGLDTVGTVRAGLPDVAAKNTRLSGISRITISRNDTLAYLQVLKNPYRRDSLARRDTSLYYRYGVTYHPGGPCTWSHDDTLDAMRFWSVPPSMIVGPDTL